MTHLNGNTTETILLFGYNWTPQEIILTICLIGSICLNIFLLSKIRKPTDKRPTNRRIIEQKESKPETEKDRLFRTLRVLITIVCVLLIITLIWKILPMIILMGASKGSYKG